VGAIGHHRAGRGREPSGTTASVKDESHRASPRRSSTRAAERGRGRALPGTDEDVRRWVGDREMRGATARVLRSGGHAWVSDS
jgi:hypothetical protein